MKEEDFDHIGKRLYEHEADPPKDGWDKIAGAINVPKTPGRFSWLKKKFWIPLVVLLPIATWLTLSEPPAPEKAPASELATPPIPELAEGPVSESPAAEPANPPVPELAEGPVSDPPASELANPPVPEPAEGPVSEPPASELATPPVPELAEGPVSEPPLTAPANPPVPEPAEGPVSDPPAPTPDVSTLNNKATALPDTIASVAEQQPSPATDTTLAVVEKEEIEEIEEIKDESNEEETTARGWRLNLSFTPQYLTKTVRPIANDEVFVTKIQSDEKKFSDRIGLGFALGAGKSITKDLYLDALLTFSQSKQNTFFSYSTGKVDTLLAVEQPDQSVRVIPVYEETDRETMSRYSYGGIRIAATYYFLSTQRGGFNLQAGAGINYLLSADVKERIAGQWVALDNTDLSKINYTLTVGAGYSLDLNTRWTLMINPSITYYLKQVKTGQLPYRLNQRPFGLNIMLSHSL